MRDHLEVIEDKPAGLWSDRFRIAHVARYAGPAGKTVGMTHEAYLGFVVGHSRSLTVALVGLLCPFIFTGFKPRRTPNLMISPLQGRDETAYMHA